MIATEKVATQNNVTETSANKKEAKPGVASPAALNRDTDLIARAQQGDPDAFATLFHAHKARIYSLCLRMTNNASEAEDLTQDAFMTVFRKLPTFRGDSALSTWLYRIAVNTVLMHFRKKTPNQVSLDEPFTNLDEAKPVRREFGTRDGRLESSVARLALTRAISELPAGYRTIFLLHQVEGYEHHEIAEFLGCSVGNTKSQLHKAKLKIREFLKSERQSEAEKVPPAVTIPAVLKVEEKTPRSSRPIALTPSFAA
jgi:RNA polymerase sigma-70 factor (ECF subfamily)